MVLWEHQLMDSAPIYLKALVNQTVLLIKLHFTVWKLQLQDICELSTCYYHKSGFCVFVRWSEFNFSISLIGTISNASPASSKLYLQYYFSFSNLKSRNLLLMKTHYEMHSLSSSLGLVNMNFLFTRVTERTCLQSFLFFKRI